MNVNINELSKNIDMLQLRCRGNIKQNYKEGTIIMVKTQFHTNSTYLEVTDAAIIDFPQNITNITYDDCFVINCFDSISSYEFTNKFVSKKTMVNSGDTIYVATANDGDPYGSFILGVFTDKPNKEKLSFEYNKHLQEVYSHDKDDDNNLISQIYIVNIFELKVRTLSSFYKRDKIKEELLYCADICKESWGDMFHFNLSYDYNKDFRKYLKNCLSKDVYAQLKLKTPLFKELGIFEILDSLDALLAHQNNVHPQDTNVHPQDTEAFNLFLNYCMEDKKFRKELKKELNDFLREVEQEQEDMEI